MDLMETLVEEGFGADAARELCNVRGLFEPNTLYKRVEISEALRDAFNERGGKTTKDAVAIVLKKWLKGTSSPFEWVRRGRYRFVGFEGQPGQVIDPGDRVFEGDEVSENDELTPAREFGKGPHEVYAWCLPRYQATSDGRWPIKIGRAGSDGLRRRLRDFQENLPERPRYLLRLRCADGHEARDREFLLHAWFRSRGQKLDDAPGEEWFLANPGEIEEAIRNITGIDDPAGDSRTPEIEDVIAAAFRDVPADDWERLPVDLTDRLDDYLYGDET